MSTERNPFAAHNTDSLVNYVRDTASNSTLGVLTCQKLHAAADRLHALYHADFPDKLCACTPMMHRDIYRAAATWGQLFPNESVEKAAAQAYPFPKISRPLRVMLSDGSVWSRGDGRTFLLHNMSVTPRPDNITGIARHMGGEGDLVKLARLLNGETELVDADCSGVSGRTE